MLKINKLHKSYKMGDSNLHVLKGINLNVEKGEMVAIMGSSGSGKSTLLNIIGILDELDSGEYTLDGIEIKDLTEKKAAQYRNKFLGFVFQSFNLINFKNALENVALPLYYQGLKRKERQEKAMFHLEKVGLADWSTHLPNELSGGQKQRVAIARALAAEPKLLLADDIAQDELITNKTDVIPLFGALLKNEQDVSLLEKLVFLSKREMINQH